MNNASRQVTSLDIGLKFAERKMDDIGRVILIGSGKGGVGKSFVASGLAIKLANSGYKVGLFDIDIHGASALNYLNVRPPATSTKNGLEPKISRDGLKVMSVALLTGDNPVPMRGGKEKQNMLTQFFSLTNWGKIDYLIVDLPPGTGDEALSAFSIFGREKAYLILVSTPSRKAISIVSRLGRLARSEGISIFGVVLNMAYLDFGGKWSYPFGKTDRHFLKRTLGSRILTEIPLDPEINTADLREIVLGRNKVADSFEKLLTYF